MSSAAVVIGALRAIYGSTMPLIYSFTILNSCLICINTETELNFGNVV